jgi:hypothetical protein
MPVVDWRAAEEEICKILGAEHVGGPGQPDCRCGAAVVEVKHHTKRVGPNIIRRTMAKPWARGLPLIVVSTSGFSIRAISFAQEHTDVFLYEGNLAEHKVRKIWPPEAEGSHREAAPSAARWWQAAIAVAGGVGVVGGAFFAFKHWASRTVPPPHSPRT